MPIVLQDRVTGQITNHPVHRVIPGRYQLLDSENIYLNSVLSSSGDFLVPDQDRKWSICFANDEQPITGEFPSDFWPPDREQLSLRALGQRLVDLVEQGGQWSDWIKVSPIVSGVDEQARSLPLDRTIDRDLWHLQEICRQPHTHLRIENERMPISRARKIPTRAVEYLASHTEDWQYKKLQSVVPKRILTEVAEEQLNIYENRVSIRLVDHLNRYLQVRLEELEKLAQELDYILQSRYGTHWRTARIWKLVAESIDPKELEKSVSATVRELRRLYAVVFQLMDSHLYRSIPQQETVPPSLKATNIFIHDNHYRHVSIMWREWMQYAQRRSTSPKEFYQNEQELCIGFDHFCVLLVLRAFDQLGFRPVDETSVHIQPGVRLKLCNEIDDQLVLEWHENGSIIMEVDEQGSPYSSLRFIPILASLRSASEPKKVEEIVKDLLCSPHAELKTSNDSISNSSSQITIILYSGDFHEGNMSHIHLQLHTLSNDLTRSTNQNTGLLPVSTFEFGSLERVARAIRWIILGSKYLSYPPKVDIPTFYANELFKLNDWLVQIAKNRASVVRIPTPEQREYLDNKVSNKIRSLTSQGKASKRKVEFLHKLLIDLEESIKRLDSLLRCPVCNNTINEPELKDQGDGHFECLCRKCDSRWGTRACGSCGTRFPFLLLLAKGTYSGIDQTIQGWVDIEIGRDVLAIPCWVADANGNFICPDCGVCTNSGSHSSQACVRCNFINDPASV